MLPDEPLDREISKSQRNNEEKGIEITTSLQRRGKNRADQDLSRKSEATFPHTGEGLSSEIGDANSDQKPIELCAKIGTERNPTKMGALISQLTRALTAEQNVIKSKIRADLSRLIAPPC